MVALAVVALAIAVLLWPEGPAARAVRSVTAPVLGLLQHGNPQGGAI